MPMASSLDTVGPIAKTVEDIAILMEAMAGHDPLDATTVKDRVPKYTKIKRLKDSKIRVGIPKEYFDMKGIDKEVKKIIGDKIKEIGSRRCGRDPDFTSGKLGNLEIIDVDLPMTKYAIPVYYIIVPSEDSSNLGRLDGTRYGVQANGKTLYDVYAKSRAQGFPEEVKRRIMMGTYALSAGYYDAYYRKAQKVRTLIIKDFEKAFEQVDVIITPTSPFPAFEIGEKANDVLAMYLADVFVAPASVAGIPAISIPAGKTRAGLPVGLQIIGPRLAESAVLNLALTIQISR